jgi:hypothetical protein
MVGHCVSSEIKVNEASKDLFFVKPKTIGKSLSKANKSDRNTSAIKHLRKLLKFKNNFFVNIASLKKSTGECF